MGLPQTQYLKDLDQISIMAKAEMGFIKMIVYPLWSLVNFFLDNELVEVLKTLNLNAESWEKIYLESSNETEKKSSFLMSLKEEQKDDDNETPKSQNREDSNYKRSKSLFSNLKKSLTKSPEKLEKSVEQQPKCP